MCFSSSASSFGYLLSLLFQRGSISFVFSQPNSWRPTLLGGQLNKTRAAESSQSRLVLSLRGLIAQAKAFCRFVARGRRRRQWEATLTVNGADGGRRRGRWISSHARARFLHAWPRINERPTPAAASPSQSLGPCAAAAGADPPQAIGILSLPARPAHACWARRRESCWPGGSSDLMDAQSARRNETRPVVSSMALVRRHRKRRASICDRDLSVHFRAPQAATAAALAADATSTWGRRTSWP